MSADKLPAQVHGAEAVLGVSGQDPGPLGQDGIEGTVRAWQAKLLQKLHGQLGANSEEQRNAPAHQIAAIRVGIIDGEIAVEPILGVVAQAQILQPHRHGGLAVQQRAVGGEDQGPGIGQRQQRPGKAAGGDGQLHAAQVRKLTGEVQEQGILRPGVARDGAALGDGIFQSPGLGTLTVQGQNGVKILHDAVQLPDLRGQNAVGAGKGRVGAVVVKGAGGEQLRPLAAQKAGQHHQGQKEADQLFHASPSKSKTGNTRVKVVPVGSVSELSTVMEPRLRSTISRTMARPRPLPPV